MTGQNQVDSLCLLQKHVGLIDTRKQSSATPVSDKEEGIEALRWWSAPRSRSKRRIHLFVATDGLTTQAPRLGHV